MKKTFVATLLLLSSAFLYSTEKVLFIRGGVGTVGFFEGGADEQGADIDNFTTSGGNHGWGELAAALLAEGFTSGQIAENPVESGVPTPIPLDEMDLNQYSIIVFGSNNAAYTTAQVNAFVDYIAAGGAGLFISDANFGQNWGDAPSSDQHFLERFGLTMNQDRGTYTVDRGQEFLVPGHPIFNGVDTFDGEGVSPITVSATVSGVTATILSSAPAGAQIRRNTGASAGPQTVETDDDGTLVIATYGLGRIAGHFDRNTFFNLNGAGTNLNRHDNEAYARNLFNWLAGKPAFDPQSDNYAPRLHLPVDLSNAEIRDDASFPLEIVAKDPDGTVARVELLNGMNVLSTDESAPFVVDIPPLEAGYRSLLVRATDEEGATTDLLIVFTVQDSSSLPQPLDRSGWTLTSNRSSGELGNAIDGNAATRWPTRQFQQSGQWFRIDFGEAETFDRIVLETLENPQDYPRGYVVRGSDDGVSFVDLVSGAGDSATTEILLGGAVSFRHLEIEQTGSSSNRWWSIHEINVLNTPGSPPSDSPDLTTWLESFFGNSPDGLTVDGDGDGQTALEEFAANTDPTDRNSFATPQTSSGTDPDTGRIYLDYTFQRWSDPNGIAYEFFAGDDLTALGPAIANQIGDPVPVGDGVERVTFRVDFPVDATRGFLRHQVRLLP